MAPSGVSGGVVSLSHLLETGQAHLSDNPNVVENACKEIEQEDIFTIIYTSGTTGDPKGVVLSHKNLVANIESLRRAMSIDAGDIQYLFLPLAHVLGRELAWVSIDAGTPMAFTRGVTRIKDDLLEIRPTFMAGVPRVFEKFYSAVKGATSQGSPLKLSLVKWAFAQGKRAAALQAQGQSGAGLALRIADQLVLGKLRAKLGLDRCRFLVSGGAPLAADIAAFFVQSRILILEGYGLTETTSAAFVNQVDNYRFGTVGPALDVVECKIAQDGEILLKGPTVFERYYNNDAATAAALSDDGWFHTGDIGAYQDGFLRITDRKKDIIVTAGGKNVAPQALENALKANSSWLSQVVVVGDNRAYCAALVTLSDNAISKFGEGQHEMAANSAKLRRLLEADIEKTNTGRARFEQIKRFHVLAKDFTEADGELTPSLKVKRKVISERYQAEIEALYR